MTYKHALAYALCTIKSDHGDTGFNDFGSFIFFPLRGFICTDFYYYRGQNYKLEPDWIHEGMIDDPLPGYFYGFSRSSE